MNKTSTRYVMLWAITSIDSEYVYVIAWVAVKFGINSTSVVLEIGQILRGKAE